MTLHLEDKWVWDFWFARDGDDTHIFYLQAPRSLGNPDLRHWHSSVGHAVSQDLIHWEILPDTLYPSDDDHAWDSLTTWTGSTFHHDQGWAMFYTGTSKVEIGKIQRIGLATSDDLVHWKKYADNPIMKIDPHRYELLDENIWYEQAWRDPWVFEAGGRFHAFITARVSEGHPKSRGVIGYACSDDLRDWEVKTPIIQPGEFAYLEVPQLVEINQRWYLLFCVESDKYSEQRCARKGVSGGTGTHYMMADDPLGPFIQPEKDLLFGDEAGSTYSGKLVQNKAGKWMFMAAIQYDPFGEFVGDISDPMPLKVKEDGQLEVLDGSK
jgi:beta-fructofuranosidase